MDNVSCYSKTCSKIGFSMILFYIFFTLSTFFVAFAEVIFENYIPRFSFEVIFGLIYAAIYFLSFSAAAFILRKSCASLPNSRRIYTSFKIDKWIVCILLSVVAVNYAMSYLNISFFTVIFPKLSSNIIQPTVSDLVGRNTSEVVILFLIEILSTAIVPAICEEYLFRGAILTNLLPFGKGTAIFASAFMFGMMHQNPLQILYTTLMGIVIGYIYVKTRSIWICMLLHFFNNLTTVLEDFLPVLTKMGWLVYLMDLIIVVGGAISIVFLLLRRSKEHNPERDGSFGVIAERGIDVEEMSLEISGREKIKRFFSVTVIVYTAVSIYSMLQTLTSFL